MNIEKARITKEALGWCLEGDAIFAKWRESALAAGQRQLWRQIFQSQKRMSLLQDMNAPANLLSFEKQYLVQTLSHLEVHQSEKERDQLLQAFDCYTQAIQGRMKEGYYGLGNVLLALGHKKDALHVYRQFLHLADQDKDKLLISRSQDIIEGLEIILKLEAGGILEG